MAVDEAPRSTRKTAKNDAPSIEEQFALIEDAVAALESGELPLEQALARYEAGVKAVRQATVQLDQYAARLEVVRAEADAPSA
jgi:exodeoxyribonuclease VII small subunit